MTCETGAHSEEGARVAACVLEPGTCQFGCLCPLVSAVSGETGTGAVSGDEAGKLCDCAELCAHHCGDLREPRQASGEEAFCGALGTQRPGSTQRQHRSYNDSSSPAVFLSQLLVS